MGRTTAFHGMDKWPEGEYVYYQRLNAKNLSISQAYAKAMSAGSFFKSAPKVIREIKNLATAERKKEIDLLLKICPNLKDDSNFIDLKNDALFGSRASEADPIFYTYQLQKFINEIIRGKDQVLNYLDYIKTEYSKKDKKEDKKLLVAPNAYGFIKSTIINMISTKCMEACNSLVRDFIKGGQALDEKEIKSILMKELTNLINSDFFMNKIINELAGKEGEDIKPFQDANAAILRTDKKLRGEFGKVIESALHIEKTVDSITKTMLKYAKEGKLSTRAVKNKATDIENYSKVSIRTIVDDRFKGNAGLSLAKIMEFSSKLALATALENNPGSKFATGSKNGGITSTGVVLGGSVFGTDVMTNDSILVLSSDIDITVQNRINEAIAQLNPQNKQESREQVQQLIEKIEREYREISNAEHVIVTTNTKNYSLFRKNGSGFKDLSQYGFSGGRRNIADLPAFANQFNVDLGGDIITFLINTIEGAKLSGERRKNTIENAIALGIIQNVMSYLFDDLTISITETANNFQSNSNVIHLIDLDGVFVSASGFLSLLGDSLQQASYDAKGSGLNMDDMVKNSTNYVSVNFNLPKSILFPTAADTTAWIAETTKDGYSVRDAEAAGAGNALEAAWNYQRGVALDSTFEVHFLKNFMDIINDLYAQIVGF